MENTVYGAFVRVVQNYSEHPALIEGSETLTYKELNEKADQIFNRLPEDEKRIGIILDHGILQITSMLATLKGGKAYVPAEPFLPDRRIDYMFSESGVNSVLTQKKYRHRILEMGFNPICLDENLNEALESDPYLNEAVPEDLAYILYTSGSTGKPKGVMVTNKNICHYVRAFQHEFHPSENDRMLQYSVCSFDIFTEEVYTTLLSGACLIIVPEELKDDIEGLMSFVDEHQVTEISGFPYLLQKMNDLPAIPKSLRLLISGGDVIRESYIDHLLNKEDHPMIYNTYGPSETTVCASYFHIRPDTALPDGTYPIGKPVLGTEIQVVREDGTLAEKNEPGELIISGDGVSDGYCGNRPLESLAFFKLEDGTPAYHSGDMGYWMNDGNLAFIARKDDQVMIDGRRVEPKEVESVLNSLDYIYQAAVRPFIDEQNLSYMTAYVVFKKDQDVPLSKLRADCALELADYMIPEYFVKLEKLPLTMNGKVDTASLPVVLKEGKKDE